MTAVLEPLAGIANETRRAQLLAEMAERQQRFDATRLPCPAYCDDTCETLGHTGDAIIHSQAPQRVAVSVDGCDPQGDAWVKAWRFEDLKQGVSYHVDLDIVAAGEEVGPFATMSPAQARQLAEQLVRSADLAEPEQDVPAEQVRVSDWMLVDGEWLEVYLVLADDASDGVQICVSADPENWSDFDYRDENPETFNFGDPVRIRREPRPTGGTK